MVAHHRPPFSIPRGRLCGRAHPPTRAGAVRRWPSAQTPPRCLGGRRLSSHGWGSGSSLLSVPEGRGVTWEVTAVWRAQSPLCSLVLLDGEPANHATSHPKCLIRREIRCVSCVLGGSSQRPVSRWLTRSTWTPVRRFEPLHGYRAQSLRAMLKSAGKLPRLDSRTPVSSTPPRSPGDRAFNCGRTSCHKNRLSIEFG